MLSRLRPFARAAAFSFAASASLVPLGLLGSCGKTVVADPESISVVVKVPSVPSDAARLKILATLNGKDAMQPLTLTDRNGFARFGVRLPLDKSGSLALKIDVYDANECLLGSATANTTIGPPVQTEISATLTLLGQRQCPPPPMPMTCAPDLFCASKVTGITQEVRSLFGFAPNDIWAVGTQGLILHYDGTNWNPVLTGTSMADPAQTLNGVWGAAANNLWVVGDGNIILRYNGSSWTRQASNFATVQNLTAVWGANASAIAYTATDMDPLKVHFIENINNVEFDYNFTRPAAATLDSVWGTAADDVWAVGQNFIMHLTKPSGTPTFGLTTTAVRLRSVWGSGANNIWAVGDGGEIWHRDLGNWTPLSAANRPTTVNLRSIWGSAANDIFAVGVGGTVIHFDGTAWTAGASGTTIDLNAIWGLNNVDIWTAGAGGSIFHSLK